MLVAVLPQYSKGIKIRAPAAELWGHLEVRIDGQSLGRRRSLRASLRKPYSNQHQAWVLPFLQGAWLVALWEDMLEVGGYEKDGEAWHLQVWRCRLVSQIEFSVATTDHRGDSWDKTVALYRRWYAELHDQGITAVHELQKQFELDDTEIWPFVEWLTRTNRAYLSGLRFHPLGELCFKAPSDAHDGKRPDYTRGELPLNPYYYPNGLPPAPTQPQPKPDPAL